MKTIVKLFGLALAAVFTFILVACNNPFFPAKKGKGNDHFSIIEQVRIPAGTFTMGSPTSEPDRGSYETQHQVTLTKGFYMGRYQVTQDQYRAVMGSNPSSFSSSPAAGETQGRRPVEMVSWYDAIEFCNKLSEMEGLTPVYTITGRTPATGYPITNATVTPKWNVNGYRLPTEAQWEYACRAGTTTAYNLGGTWNDNWGWVDTNSNGMTHEVGKKTPNAYGLYDMHGNVYEWCWDWYDANYGGAAGESATDPVGAASGSYRVFRGGYCFNSAQFARSAFRYYINPYFRDYYFGFRILRP
ncbi:MAG: formylglycine-generating enzyme family protein [Treponema sp.]|jgi:formylglycine-generating enzyme required for sulfatase activity|nr:formylglycine-generating enzyme family protein [Treponema sp.]